MANVQAVDLDYYLASRISDLVADGILTHTKEQKCIICSNPATMMHKVWYCKRHQHIGYKLYESEPKEGFDSLVNRFVDYHS